MKRFMEKIKPNELPITFSTELFFDTNIWLLIYGPFGDFKKNRQKAYTALFESVVSKNCSIYLSSMVLSEYANVVLRYEFSIWKEKKTKMGADYKRDFVGTETYQEKVRSVKEQLNAILNLPNIIKLPDNFNAISLDNVFSDFGASDFNDAYINETVNSKNLILVTDDGDFEAIYKGKKLVTMS